MSEVEYLRESLKGAMEDIASLAIQVATVAAERDEARATLKAIQEAGKDGK